MTQHRHTYGIVCFCILIVCLLFSCCRDKNNIAEILREMESHKVELGVDKMPCIINGLDTINYCPKNYRFIMVVNIDSTECSACHISKITQWSEWTMLAEKEESGFSLIFIVQPRQGEEAMIIDELKQYSKLYYKRIPIYIDKNGTFLKKNFHKGVPPDMQTMLIDDEMYVVYVGNPLDNDNVKRQIKNIIN